MAKYRLNIFMNIKTFLFCIFSFLVISHAFAQSERVLVDTRLRSSSVNVLKKFGDPNEIIVNNFFGVTEPIITNFGRINSTSSNENQIVWIYNYKTYKVKFKLNDYSSIGSITLEGSLSNYKTSKNIKLGSFYSDVIKAYGMPDHEYENDSIIKLVYRKNNLYFIVHKNNDKFKSSYKVSGIELNSIEN
jgi:hypothetical protein